MVKHLTRLRTPLRRLWLKAKGCTDPYRLLNWPPFRRFPTRCELCGRLENPLINEEFIAVHGVIIECPLGYDFYHGWYCKQLNLMRPTGYAVPHFRHVCHRHGEFLRRSLTDCLTGVEHTLLPQPSLRAMRLSNAFHEAGYWLQVAARFPWLCLVEVVTELYYQWLRKPRKPRKPRKGNKG